jgi:hypothetical protein
MSELKRCPADGCDFQGAEEQITGHWGGKQEGVHEGPFPGLEGDDGTSEASDPDPDPEPEPGSAGADNPTMPSGSPATAATTDAVELPCGHDSYDPRDAPEPPFNVRCATCGERYGVTE